MNKLKKILLKIKQFLNKDFFEEVQDIVLYICGNEALPSPLEQDEEFMLLEEMEKGNASAKNKLIEHNLRLVVYIAKKFDNTGIDMEDLISIGAIGLIKAVKTYKFDKKIKLATYASRCIENEILMYLRKTNKEKAEVSFEEPLKLDAEGNELLLGDVIGTDADIVSRELEKKAEIDILYQSFKTLTPREIMIIKMRYGLMNEEEKTQKEVAEMLGISQSYISRLEKRIIKKLQKEIVRAD